MNKKIVLSSVLCSLLAATSYADSNPIAIAIHGGAGVITRDALDEDKERAIRETLEFALRSGYAVLEQGGSSEQAIINAIIALESSPLFNAGVGAVYTHDATHELDASIMLGHNRQAGAVSGIQFTEHPILAAQAVLHQSVHVMLSGDGADEFSRSIGLPQVENSFFNTPFRREQLDRAKQQTSELKAISNDHEQIALLLDDEFKFGTVGAVALDQSGNLAAGTSTGGMTNKRFGRVGDAPIIGAGTFADNDSCAVSATGHGEYFIRYNVASDICARVEYLGESIEIAGQQVISELLEVGGTGGVIITNRDGAISMPFNTEGMYRASIDASGKVTIQIFSDED